MFREKTIIRIRKREKPTLGLKPYWKIRRGTYFMLLKTMGISRLFRLLSTLIQDKHKVYSIDVVIKRRE